MAEEEISINYRFHVNCSIAGHKASYETTQVWLFELPNQTTYD